MDPRNAFLGALASSARSPELDDVDDLFGFLIGSWEIDAVLIDANGLARRTQGEVHASWVLEGRAIQDLFIFPQRGDRTPGARASGERHATTIRTYDRRRTAWRVAFINPAAAETSAELIARRDGDAIAMEGQRADGVPIRWRYPSATERSFRYAALELSADRQTWRTYLEIFGKRPERT